MFGGEPNSKFVALELVDGRLYFVHNFGRGARRTAFSQKDVADGQVHEVEVILRHARGPEGGQRARAHGPGQRRAAAQQV